MSDAAIGVGDKLHIITRRRFESDVRRHFAGEVTAMSGQLQEVHGFAFVFESGTNEYRRRPELRTRLFDLGQEGFIVTKLPRDLAIESLRCEVASRRLVITDGGTYSLDINEFGSGR